MIILVLENYVWGCLGVPYIQTSLYGKMMNQIEPVDCAFSLLKILELDAHNNRMDQFQGFAYSDLAHSWH